MNPVSDTVCALLETPFSRWKDEDKKDILTTGRPTTALSISVKKKKNGKSYNVNFKNSWFSEFPWLCSSPYLEKLFCWPCLLFSNNHNVWNKEGFSDFKNITRALNKHKDSAQHLKCKLQLNTFLKNRNTIADAIRENARLHLVHFNENVRLNRIFFQLIIDSVLYLSKQELGFRGHDESVSSINRGNFKELLALLISRSPLEIQNHYSKISNVFTGDSKTIQNEVLDCISDYINDHVKNEIHNTTFFAIEVDDSTDITQTSQCSMIIRYVNSEGIIVERFLGFHNVSADRSSEALFSLLDGVLSEFGYENKLVAQCYDGASVMAGHLNGLQKKVKDKAPQSVFVHCLAHRLNLVLQQSLECNSKCRIFFASISGIPSFFHHSSKRTHVIDSLSARRIPTLAETRWCSNSKLLNVIVEDWENLKQAFELIMNDKLSDKKSIQLSKGFLNDMNSFEFTFLAVVFNDIFSLTDVLFDVLQKKSLDITYCISKIKSTCAVINNKRNDQYFSELFEKVKGMTSLTRRREYSTMTEDEIFRNFRILFFEILDTISMEMKVRFQDCDNLQFLGLVDTSKFDKYAKDFPSTALENLQHCYPLIFNKIDRLKNELRLLYADEVNRSLSTAECFKLCQENKDVFEESYKLFALVLTIPSTSASVERSFSCLNRIKSFRRNTISQERLTALANISIQKELLCELMKEQPFYEDITDRFAALKNRRIDLIYKK